MTRKQLICSGAGPVYEECKRVPAKYIPFLLGIKENEGYHDITTMQIWRKLP
jgi:hypothetical protein